MPSNALAVFAPKAPVEPTASTQDWEHENGSDFKDFMETAAHKVETAKKPSKEESPKNQNHAGKTENSKSKPKTQSKKGDKPAYQETPVQTDSKPQTAPKTLDKESSIEDTEILAAQLTKLDINQAQFEALLSSLGLDGEPEMDALLQSLTQALNLNPGSSGEKINPGELIAGIQQNKGEAVNLLKQAGLSEGEAIRFLDQLQSLQNASAQKELNKSATSQVKLDSETLETDETNTRITALDNGQTENSDERPDLLNQLKNTGKTKGDSKNQDAAKGKVKTDRSASRDKLPETTKPTESPRITNQEPVIDKSDKVTKTSSLGELMNDKNTQANIVQKESFADGKNIKGLDVAKTAADQQVQPSTASANTIVKAVESSKPILPENLLARGASETKIISQIADKMTIRSNGAQNEVHIKLDPPSLGTVRMNIMTSGETVRTVIIAENQAVKQVIENNFNQLRDAMGEQGLKLDSFSVTVGGESEGHNPSGENLGGEKNPSFFDQTVSNDTGESSGVIMDSLFFGDNQSISIIA